MFKRLFGRREEPQSPDAGVISQLERLGADLAKPRDTVHYLYFPTQDAADGAAVEVRARGLNVNVRPAATGSSWLVLANHDLVVSESSITAERQSLEAICAKFGGEYDGWEAAMD